jgi:hypothetical protein
LQDLTPYRTYQYHILFHFGGGVTTFKTYYRPLITYQYHVALSVLAYFFFAKAHEQVKVGIFVLLFLGVLGFGGGMFRASTGTSISPQPAASTATLSQEAKTLLKGAALDPSGLVLYEQYGAGVDLHTNGKSLLTSKADHHAIAVWESVQNKRVRSLL